MGNVLNLPLAGSPSSKKNGRDSETGGRKYWLKDGVPPGIQNEALASHTMWAANHGISLLDSWAIWRAIMVNPGSGPHKRGWTLDTFEYDKHAGSYASAVSKVKREAVEQDESWSAIKMSDIDPADLPLGEMGPDGIIFDHGLFWLYGKSGDGKTVVAYHIAIERARAGHTIALLDDEMGPESSARMFYDLGATKEDIDQVFYLQWQDGDTPNLLESGASLSVFLEYIEADILIMDCMNAFLSAADLNDNSSTDIRKMLQAAVNPSRKAQRAILVIDHKGHSREEARARGSSDKMPACDMMIGLECPDPFYDGKSGHVLLTCDKDRNAKVRGMTLQVDMVVNERTIRPSATDWFRMEEIEPVVADPEPAKPRVKPRNVNVADTQNVIIDILIRCQDGLYVREIMEETDLNRDQVRSALKRGKEHGIFITNGKGKWYYNQ